MNNLANGLLIYLTSGSGKGVILLIAKATVSSGPVVPDLDGDDEGQPDEAMNIRNTLGHSGKPGYAVNKRGPERNEME